MSDRPVVENNFILESIGKIELLALISRFFFLLYIRMWTNRLLEGVCICGCLATYYHIEWKFRVAKAFRRFHQFSLIFRTFNSNLALIKLLILFF